MSTNLGLSFILLIQLALLIASPSIATRPERLVAVLARFSTPDRVVAATARSPGVRPCAGRRRGGRDGYRGGPRPQHGHVTYGRIVHTSIVSRQTPSTSFTSTT
jgi:hypothetical protein